MVRLFIEMLPALLDEQFVDITHMDEGIQKHKWPFVTILSLMI